RLALQRVRALEAEGYTVALYGVGKKGIKYFQHARRTLAQARIDIGDRPTAAHALDLVTPLIAEYEAGRLASLEVVYGSFKSALSTPPALIRVLPIEAGGSEGRKGGKAEGRKETQANYI